ncbi:FkbM family methyltransferase [Synechocystis sp. PCC 7339]|uniref:FkbM family methyltransferase n=1 Tax=Synechocystis sp. PCC 7339 TaxID=2782213 RepID=UPI001CC13877|nr:FkbM family methyltransferase [Synechocystis sp. PCC 7339]
MLKEIIKNNKSFYLKLRFIRSIPQLWREFIAKQYNEDLEKFPAIMDPKDSDYLSVLDVTGNRIMVQGNGEEYFPIYAPDNVGSKGGFCRTYRNFYHQSFAFYMRKEVKNFIKYAKKCKIFIDIGAEEGYYSALFASMHDSSAEIFSVDCFSLYGCTPEHLPITRQINSAAFNPARWEIIPAYVSDSTGKPCGLDIPNNVRAMRLINICDEFNIKPDLLKFDIESSELEVILDSEKLLSSYSPILIIEVHHKQLKERGKSFLPALTMLKKIGYDVVETDRKDWELNDAHIVLAKSA